jgi:hypothetical protein
MGSRYSGEYIEERERGGLMKRGRGGELSRAGLGVGEGRRSSFQRQPMLPPQGLFLLLHYRIQGVLVLCSAIIDAGLMSLSLCSLSRQAMGGKRGGKVQRQCDRDK